MSQLINGFLWCLGGTLGAATGVFIILVIVGLFAVKKGE